jgi:hypothetical protein
MIRLSALHQRRDSGSGDKIPTSIGAGRQGPTACFIREGAVAQSVNVAVPQLAGLAGYLVRKMHAEQYAKRTASMPCPDFDFSGGSWVNELGSKMELTVDSNGTVTGRYQSAVSDNGGPTPWFDLAGTSCGGLISFAVNWGTEITAWIGHGAIDEVSGPEILTLWQLVKNVPDIENPETQWKTVMAGADSFVRP